MSAINDQVATSHETASIAQHKEGRTLKLMSVSNTTHHILALPLLTQAGDLLKVLLHHRCQDVARADAVDADAAGAVRADGAPLHGEVAGELLDGSLGRVVDRGDEALVGDGAGDAGDEDHAAAALVAEHLARGRRGRHEHALEVDVHHARHVLGLVLRGRGDLLDAGGGHDAVEPAVLFGDQLDLLVEAVHVAHILLPVVEEALVFGDFGDAVAGFFPFAVGVLVDVETVYWLNVSLIVSLLFFPFLFTPFHFRPHKKREIIMD